MARIKQLYKATSSGNEDMYPVTEATLVGSDHGTLLDEVPYMVSPDASGSLSDGLIPPAYGLQTGASTRGGGFTLGSSPFLKYAYGIERDITNSSTSCTRIGNMSLHVSLPVQSGMRRCLLLDDGSVNYYLSATDSTKKEDGTDAVLDGSDGMVMVEIPAHWRRFEQDGNIMRAWVSEVALPGFHFVPKCYRSAYEASLDRSVSGAPKLASVVNTTAAFRGGNNTADWDGTYRSLLGMPVSTVSLTNFRSYARNRGAAGLNGAGWNCDVYEVQKTCYWLYVIEYADLNCQLTFNASLSPDGYHQGGLGLGVSDMPDWNTYNSSNPFIPCGVTNSLGNATGVVSYTVMSADGSAYYTPSVPSYRGLENPFGHIWSLTDGCKCNIQSEDAGGVSEFFVCDDPAKYQDSDYTGYEKRGVITRRNGYVKAIVFGEYGENMPLEVGGNGTSYFCDYAHTSIPTTAEALRGVMFGGYAVNETPPGLTYSRTSNSTEASGTGFGSRLCFLPSEEASEWYHPTGATTTNGYYSSKDSSLMLSGDRTWSFHFTTGPDFSVSQCVFVDTTGWSGLYVAVTDSRAVIVYLGSTVVHSVPATASTSYLVTVTLSSAGYNVYVNGELQKSGSFALYTPTDYMVGHRPSPALGFNGVIHSSRLFNYALSATEVTALWNGGNPSGYVVPNSLKCPVLDFPTSIFTASRNTFTANNPGTVSNITFDVPAANGFSGPFAREEAILRLSTYCAFHNRDTYVDIPIKVKVEYRCNYALYSAREDGVLLLPANEGNAKEATIVYGPGFGYLATPGNVSDGWAEIRVLSIESVGCIAEYLPAGLSATSWAPSVGDASLSATGTPRVVSLPLVGDEVVKTDYWSAFPVEAPYTISIVFKTGDTVSGAAQCLFSSSELSGTGIRVEINANARFQFRVGSNNRLGTTVTSNTLYCLQIVYDGTSVTFYDNGDRSSFPFTDAFTSTTFVLGNYGDGAAPFLGEIVSCHVLNYAASAADVKALWNGGDPVRSAFLTGVLGMDLSHSYSYMSPMTLDGWGTYPGTDVPPVIEDGAIKCAFNSPAVTSYKNGIYRNVGAFTNGKRVVLKFKMKSTVEGSRVLRGLSGGAGNLIAASNVTLSTEWEEFSYITPANLPSLLDTIVFYPAYNSNQTGFYYVKDIVVKEIGCVSEYRPSGVVGTGLTPAFSKATVTGVFTQSGWMRSSDSTLAFAGDRSIELLFTVNELPGNTVRIFSDSVNLQPSSFVILLSNTGTIVGRIGGSYVYIKSDPVVLGGTYHVVLTISPSGQSGSSYLNGVVIQQITSLLSYNIPVHCSLGGNSISATFPGVIHHCRLFNYALSSDEVSALWNGGNPAGYVVPEEMQGFDLSHSYSYMSPMTLDGWFNYDGTDIPPVIEDGAIKCAFNSPAVTSYKNGIYREFDPFTEGKRIILKFKIKSSVSGNKVNAGLASSSGTSLYAAKLLTLTDDWEEYVIEAYNNFKSSLNSAVFYPGYNLDQTGFYYVKDVEVKEVGCVAEYLPDHATVDAWYPSIGSAVLSAVKSPRPVGGIVTGASMWRDSSGAGGPALAAVGSPSMSYAPVPAEDEIIEDSEYFVTDISTAVKNVFVPQGYVPVSVTVYNGNPSDITNVSVTLGNASRFAVYGATVASGSSVTGYIGNATTGGALLTRIIVNGLTSSFYIGVNATGNTSSGGMRVKVRCRYALGE